MIRNQPTVGICEAPLPGRKRIPAIVGVFISVLVHCTVWFALQALRGDMSVRHERAVELPSPVMVYLPPAPGQSPHAPAVESTRQKKPLSASARLPQRERKRTYLNAEADTQIAHRTTREADVPTAMDTLQVENSTETPVRFDADTLKALVKQDLERQGTRSGHAAGRQEPGVLAADVRQDVMERARRPKCDNDYRPKVGSVEFGGLMKLPFLLRGGLADEGCKW